MKRNMLMDAFLMLVLVAATGCSSFHPGIDGGNAVDGSPDGVASGNDAGSLDGGAGGDLIACIDGGCSTGGAYYCVGGAAQSFQSRCCAGTSNCPTGHGDGSRTFYDCAPQYTCTESEARCFCDIEVKLGGGVCEDLNVGPAKAVCRHAGQSCFCWGYEGSSQCGTAGYSQASGSCATLPGSTGWF